MGGQTSSTDINKSENKAFNKTQNELQNSSQTGTTSGALTPWAGNSDLLNNIFAQLGWIQPGPSPGETGALNQLTAMGAGGNRFAPAIGGVADTLLAGGGPDRTGMVNDAYSQYQRLLSPTASGDYLDPNRNPFFAKTTETIGNDIQSRINGMFAGAGRDLSGLNTQTLARGLAEGTAPIYSDVYNRERGNQLDAIRGLFGAGGTTAGLLSSLDQTRLGNRTAGIGAAGAANDAQMWGPMQILSVEAQRRGIPLQTLAAQYGMAFPAAQAFGTQAGNTSGAGTSSGYSSGFGGVTGQSTEQQTKSTPFNPWSLAPLALAPFTGGMSLAGMGAGAAGGGLFSALSNGFKPGMY